MVVVPFEQAFAIFVSHALVFSCDERVSIRGQSFLERNFYMIYTVEKLSNTDVQKILQIYYSCSKILIYALELFKKIVHLVKYKLR